MIKIIIGILVFLLLGLSYFWIKILPRLGAKPKGDYLAKISKSINFDQKRKRFVNAQEDVIEEAEKNIDTLKVTREFLFPKNQVTPKKKFPEVKPNLEEFISNADFFGLIWLGHSSFLLRMAGSIILVDPVFSVSAAPIDILTPRFQPPILSLDELPKIDAIVISHDHYDHLDSRTIEYFKDTETKFFVPLGIRAHLTSWGIKDSLISELDWWDEIKWQNLEIICTPAQHFSGRISPYENKTLWASWIFKSKSHKIYFSGDSGYGPHFKQIGDKYGPFDLALLENGQYDDQWKPVHLHPEETAQAYFDLKSKALIPVHWGMFNMALHNWYDPIEEIEKHSKIKNIVLLTPKIGELVTLEKPVSYELWWKELIE